MFVRTQILYMLHLNFRRIFALCLFINYTEEQTVCPKPQPPANMYLIPERESYHIGETVSFSCKTQQYLFGHPRQTCLKNGNWSGTTPYCLKATSNITLKKEEEKYRGLVDDFRYSCLLSLNRSLNSMYIQINGIHQFVVIMIYPEQIGNAVLVSYYDYYFGIYNFEDINSHVECHYITDNKAIFKCDFYRYLENPIIIITVRDNQRLTYFFLCEVHIFIREVITEDCFPLQIEHVLWNASYNTSYPIGTTIAMECEDGYESSFKSIMCKERGQWSPFKCIEVPVGYSKKILIYVLVPGIFVILTLIVVILIVLKRRKKKKSYSNNAEEEAQYEEVGEYGNNNRGINEAAVCHVHKEDQYDIVKEDGHSVHLPINNTFSLHTTQEHQPIYVDEIPEFSACVSPVLDEEGYLVSKTYKQSDKGEETMNQTDNVDIYYSVP